MVNAVFALCVALFLRLRAARVARRFHWATALVASLAVLGIAKEGLAQSFATVAPLPVTEVAHAAVLLGSGKVLIVGGIDDAPPYLPTRGAWLYDPASNSWSAAGSLATGRTNPTLTLLANGKVLASGGRCGTTCVLSSAELYDPIANSWSSGGSLGVARALHTATRLGNGKVLVAGGSCDVQAGCALGSVELYDPATNSWSAAASLSAARYLHTTTLLANGKALVVGGGSTFPLNTTELYDPLTNTWSAAAPLAAERAGHTATLLQSGKVLVVAGWRIVSRTGIAELYDPSTNSW